MPGIRGDLRTYVRLEYNGDGAAVRNMIARPWRKAPARRNGSARGFLRYLIDALGEAFASLGGA